jgi:hypothetical protein
MTSPRPDEQPPQPVAPQPTYVDPITGAPLYVDPVSGQLVYGPMPGAPAPDLAPTTVPLAGGNVSSPYNQPMEGMPSGYPLTGYQPVGYQPTGYPPAAGGYTYQIGAYPYTVGRRTNSLAIASLVCGISAFPMLSCYGVGAIAGLVAAILGHVSRKQIRERGDAGAGMALAGIICGYAAVVIGLAIIGFFVWIFTHIASQGGVTVN